MQTREESWQFHMHDIDGDRRQATGDIQLIGIRVSVPVPFKHIQRVLFSSFYQFLKQIQGLLQTFSARLDVNWTWNVRACKTFNCLITGRTSSCSLGRQVNGAIWFPSDHFVRCWVDTLLAESLPEYTRFRPRLRARNLELSQFILDLPRATRPAWSPG